MSRAKIKLLPGQQLQGTIEEGEISKNRKSSGREREREKSKISRRLFPCTVYGNHIVETINNTILRNVGQIVPFFPSPSLPRAKTGYIAASCPIKGRVARCL